MAVSEHALDSDIALLFIIEQLDRTVCQVICLREGCSLAHCVIGSSARGAGGTEELRLEWLHRAYRRRITVVKLQPFMRKWMRHEDGRNSRVYESGEEGPTASEFLLLPVYDVMAMIDALVPRH